MMAVSQCRSCNSDIIWAATTDGNMPVDAEPRSDGNVELLIDDDGVTRAIVHGQPSMFTTTPLFVAHFVTCPDADEWRQR